MRNIRMGSWGALLAALLWAMVASAQPECRIRTFCIRDGLAANSISGIAQDSQGMIWISTWNGLCCFDGYEFIAFRNHPGDTATLSNNRLLMVEPNSEDDIWVATYDKHPYLFDSKTCRFVDINKKLEQKFGSSPAVRRFYCLNNGYSWLVGRNGINVRIKDDSAKGDMEAIMFGKGGQSLMGQHIRKIVEDNDGAEWIFTEKGTETFDGKHKIDYIYEHLVQVEGMVFLLATDGRLTMLDKTSGQTKDVSLPGAIGKGLGLWATSGGQVLIGTERGLVVASKRGEDSWLVSISGSAGPDIVSAKEDGQGRLWAFSSGGGVALMDKDLSGGRWLNPVITSAKDLTTSLKPMYNEDETGTVWVATPTCPFSYYCESEACLKQYPIYDSDDLESPWLNSMKKFYVDNQANLWFTGYGNLSMIDFRYQQFKKKWLMADNETRAICNLSGGGRLAGMGDGILAYCDDKWGIKGYVNADGAITSRQTRPLEGKVYALHQDKRGRIWIGTKGGGLYMLRPAGEGLSGRMLHFKTNPQDPYSISCNDIYSIDEDEAGNIWIGGYGEGGNLLKETGDGHYQFLNYRTAGANKNAVDFKQIRRITHTKEGIIIVSTTDGLATFDGKGVVDGSGATLYTSKHIEGDPASIGAQDVAQTLVSKSGKVYVATMTGGLQEVTSESLLTDNLKLKSIDVPFQSGGLILSLSEDGDGRIWIVRESSIDMYDPGTGEHWMFGPNDLGEHTDFCETEMVVDEDGIIACGIRGGVVSFDPRKIEKSLFAPPIMFTSVYFQGGKEPQPIVHDDVLKVAADKRNFTINFSALDYSNNRIERYAYMVEGLDHDWNYTGPEHKASFSRFPPGRYKLKVRSTNADGIWVDNTKTLIIDAEPNFFESIYGRILYGAMALIVVLAVVYFYLLRKRAQMQRDVNEMKTRFYTDISHKLRTPLTLIGGPVEEVLENEQLSQESRDHLTMVKRNSRQMLDLVNKMLEEGEGANYIVDDDNLPVFGDKKRGETPALSDAQHLRRDAPQRASAPAAAEDSVRILLVEDNDDLRAFLVSILHDRYSTLEARNGKEGLGIAAREMPDFIITDIMMPVMDGMMMIHEIKANKNICHIPIIVLSAKASMEDRLQGLREGVDDYITKPFSATYLRQRVENIIGQRAMLQRSVLEQISSEEGPGARSGRTDAFGTEAPIPIVDADKEMMDRLMAYMEKNIDNPDMKIDDLADAVNLGRTVFYGKLKSIVGMAPVDFVRHVRMQRAEQLVARTNEAFSQIAYMVGFSDPKYFSKCFKKSTGMTPSEYRDANKRQ